MIAGPLAGWIALALVPAAAAAGWALRRFAQGAFVRRMRPHFVFGYAALALALFHVGLSMGAMRGADSTGIWLATIALLALILQTLIGTNLQSPGGYRRPLRAWHLLLFAAIGALGIGHVALNSAIGSEFAGRVGNGAVVGHPLGLPLRIVQQSANVFEKAPLAAHAVHRVRCREIRAGTALACVAEQSQHPALVSLDLGGALGNESPGLFPTQLPEQHECGFQSRIARLRIDDHATQQFAESRFAGA